MKVCVLASGSKGNSTCFITDESINLIDIGINTTYIEKKLSEIGINAKNIDNIFLTHTHADHISGLKVFLKKYRPKVYLTKGMYNEIYKETKLYDYEIINDDFYINNLYVQIIKTSHDAPDSVGYIFTNNDSSFVYITDTGYINVRNHNKLLNKNLYIIESNHDINLLMNGKYPYYLKQRILGDKGHLSNKDSATYLSKFIGSYTKKIILAHLSEENNNKEIVLTTFKQYLKQIKTEDIIIAEQNDKTEVVEV
ncbi:MAG TPA: MBL fold metallo-hydrolase [Tenericutes bacterium]|nr:MBL fold metallo-hydrolase [Mycoplasmatota bacterium]